jgi:predicted amidophosphoribosyltransferase
VWPALTELLDAVYPRLCRLCEAPAPDGVACGAHAWPVGRDRTRCGCCAAPLGRGLPDGFPCPDCRAHLPPFSRAVACADYRRDGVVRGWLLAFKHRGRRDLAEPLGHWLAERLSAIEEPACLVPIPLHPLRHLERGYDQAALLARAAGRRLGWPVVPALVRTRATPYQGGIGAPARRANVHGAFALDRLAARVLRRAGARRVGVACLARAAGGVSSAR